MTTLVLGATGLLGNAVLRSIFRRPELNARGVIRSERARSLFPAELTQALFVAGELDEPAAMRRLFIETRPKIVINCIAVGRPTPTDPMRSIQIYSVLPQRLSILCRQAGARLIQISSDGVFAGTRGSYTEDDLPDATDVYGISKQLGEVGGDHALNLRTSIIGHETPPGSGLIDWFLAQQGECRCFTRAIFSGFPTIVLANLIRDLVIPRPDLRGVYHVATDPISKFDLLKLVADRYGKKINLIADDRASPDRSLSAARFEHATGYRAPDWPALIDAMYSDRFATTRA